MEVLQSYLDGETDTAEARKVAGHLHECDHCDSESQVYERIKSSLTNCRPDVDPEVIAALTEFGEQLQSTEPVD